MSGFNFVSRGSIDPLATLKSLVDAEATQTLEADCALADLALALVATENAATQAHRLEYAKPSVRDEVFRQLNRARTHVLNHLSQRHSLDELGVVHAAGRAGDQLRRL
jgi:hypothetical protein